MWIPPSEPDEEDEEEEVDDNPQRVYDFIKWAKSQPNYIPPERREEVMAERRQEFEERIRPFRKKAEEFGIVFTQCGLDEVLSNKANLSRYRAILPYILEYLPKYDEPGWHFAFGKLLATPFAGREGAQALVQSFLQSQSPHSKWESGSFLEKNPHPSVASDLIKILENREYGRDRERVIVALAKTRDPRAFEAVSKLIDEPYLTGHVIEALGIIGDPRAISLIEPHLLHKMPWVRKLAAKVLKRLQPSSAVH